MHGRNARLTLKCNRNHKLMQRIVYTVRNKAWLQRWHMAIMNQSVWQKQVCVIFAHTCSIHFTGNLLNKKKKCHRKSHNDAAHSFTSTNKNFLLRMRQISYPLSHFITQESVWISWWFVFFRENNFFLLIKHISIFNEHS